MLPHPNVTKWIERQITELKDVRVAESQRVRERTALPVGYVAMRDGFYGASS